MGALNIIACTLMAAGAAVAYWQYAMLQGKEVALGRVVALPEARGSKGGTTYGIDAVFSDRAGNEHRYVSTWKASSPGYRVGDPIRIYFDRRDPGKCGLCTFGARFAVAWFVFLAGAGIFLGVWGMRHGNERMEKIFPVTVHPGAASHSSAR